jgi:hypothetical protein
MTYEIVLRGSTWAPLLGPPQTFIGGMTSVKDYGARGDGVTDDTAAINAARTAGVPLLWPRGDYLITTTINGMTGQAWIGEPGARLFSSTLTNLVNLGNAADVRIEGMTFESTLSNSTNDIYGLIFSASTTTLKRVIIRNCTFTCATRNTNGIKIVADSSAASAVDNVLIDSCRFDTCGRMGFEVQDHTSPNDTVNRFRNVQVVNSAFKSCAKLGTGIALSFSGCGLNCRAVGNYFIDIDTIAVEFARDHSYPEVVGNVFDACGDSCKLISFSNPTNTNLVASPAIRNNSTIGRNGLGVAVELLSEARFHDNRLITVGDTMDYRRSRRGRASGEFYDTANHYALYVESFASGSLADRSTWDMCAMSTANSSVAFAVARFNGDYATDNKIIRSRLAMGSVGVVANQQNNAYGNSLVECEQSATPYSPGRTIALTDADRTLTLLDVDGEFLDFTGTLTATRTITFPRARRIWQVRNSTSQSLTLTAGSGTVSLATAAVRTYILTDNTGILI